MLIYEPHGNYKTKTYNRYTKNRKKAKHNTTESPQSQVKRERNEEHKTIKQPNKQLTKWQNVHTYQ